MGDIKKIIFIMIFCFLEINLFSQEFIIKKVSSYLENISCDFKTQDLLYVSIEQQKMFHIKENKVIKTFIISSSKYGIGNKEDSNKTPIGLHEIKLKYGDETPLNGVMKARKYTGTIAKIFYDTTRSKTDDVTSRVLWLSGLESGKNKGYTIDSFKRYIYIHGTSEEGLLGTPASHGCIRMKNKDVIELYEKIKIGTLVLIL